jgi:sugar (pentulose or hexulose) kinase
MSSLEAVMGIDLGTTSTKVLVQDVNGRHLSLVEGRTPWTTTADGGTETTVGALVDLVVGLLGTALEKAQATSGDLRVVGVGVAGLGESGVLVDGSGRPGTPVIAWYDRRGEEQVARVRLRHPDFARVRAPHRPALGQPGQCRQADVVRRPGFDHDCGAPMAEHSRIHRPPLGWSTRQRTVAGLSHRSTGSGQPSHLA